MVTPLATVAISQKSAPRHAAAISLAAMTRPRRGTVMNVAAAVCWENSSVATRMPTSIANKTLRTWPEVIMLAAIAATPAGVRARAAWASACACARSGRSGCGWSW